MSFSRNTPPGTLKLKPRDRIIAPAKWITKNDRKRRPIDGPGSTEQQGRPLILDTSRFLPSSPPSPPPPLLHKYTLCSLPPRARAREDLTEALARNPVSSAPSCLFGSWEQKDSAFQGLPGSAQSGEISVAAHFPAVFGFPGS